MDIRASHAAADPSERKGRASVQARASGGAACISERLLLSVPPPVTALWRMHKRSEPRSSASCQAIFARGQGSTPRSNPGDSDGYGEPRGGALFGSAGGERGVEYTPAPDPVHP